MVLPACDQVQRQVCRTHHRQQPYLISVVVASAVLRVGDHDAFPRQESVTPQQRGIVRHVADRIRILAGKQEASAFSRERGQRCQFRLRQVPQRAEEDQQVFRIRHIAPVRHVLVDDLILVVRHQGFEARQRLLIHLPMALQDHCPRDLFPRYIGDGAGDAPLVGPSRIGV